MWTRPSVFDTVNNTMIYIEKDKSVVLSVKKKKKQ